MHSIFEAMYYLRQYLLEQLGYGSVSNAEVFLKMLCLIFVLFAALTLILASIQFVIEKVLWKSQGKRDKK